MRWIKNNNQEHDLTSSDFGKDFLIMSDDKIYLVRCQSYGWKCVLSDEFIEGNITHYLRIVKP